MTPTAVSSIDELDDNLYLTSIYGVYSNAVFVDKMINVLFCVAAELESHLSCLAHLYPDKRILFIPLVDTPSQTLDIGEYASCIHDYIRRGRRVLVFCHMGISRSASICIGYFMKFYNMTFSQGELFVKRKRDIIYPNSGFVQQLKKKEKREKQAWRNKK